MATSAGEVEVKLTLNADDFKRMLGESQNSVGQFGGALQQLQDRLLAVFSFAAIADFFKQSLDAYAASQLATARLVATLAAHGVASEELVNHLARQSEALEALTGIQQVNITSTQAMLSAYGIQGPLLDKATTAAANFAARTGSIETATNLLAKAYEGNTTMLKRYGLTVDQTLQPQQQFEALLTKINALFGPLATAQVGTFSGQMTALGNAFTHLEEAVGKLLAGPGGSIVSWVTSLVKDMTQMVTFLDRIAEATHSFADVVQGVVILAVQTVFMHLVNILDVMLSIASHLPLIGNQFAALRSQVDMLKVGIQAMDKAQQDQYVRSVSSNTVLMQNEKDKLAAYKNSAQEHMNVDAVMEAWIQNQNLLSKNAFMANLKEEDMGFHAFADAFITTQAELWAFAGRTADTFFKGISDAWAQQVIEGKNFTESIKKLFQSMAEQIISYLVQIIIKLTAVWVLEQATGINIGGAGSAPSVFSGISGAFAGGGMINEPSIITGLRSGTKVLAGEAGPEMVVPMDGSGGDAGGGGGGGQNITINIQGQFLEADSATWNKLMRDQIIPQIRRFTMISSTGPFNRTRGVV